MTAFLTFAITYSIATAGAWLTLGVHNERDASIPSADRHINPSWGAAWPFLVVALAVLVLLRFVKVRWREAA